MENLYLAIIEQAIKDYKDLQKRGVKSYNDSYNGKYSIREITRFFKSEWCEHLLTYVNVDFSGEDILNILENKAINCD